MEYQALVWAKTEEREWAKGEIIKRATTNTGRDAKVVVRFEGSAITREFSLPHVEDVDLPELKLRNVPGQATAEEGKTVQDLIELTHLHEPAILYTLHERYDDSQIYTYTGPILIAINPFWRVPLYSSSILETYQKDGQCKYADPDHVSTLSPHVYAVADNAYRLMSNPASSELKQDQSILVSGESGAGKTETTKIIMRYLAIVGGRHHSHKEGGGELAVYGIEQRVLQSNPILEAFGNARTVRNDNSSRFGKFIELHFDGSYLLHGAAIRTFLLEKVRLVRQSPNERNYHVFYMICAGASEEEKERWCLRNMHEYHFMNQSGCYERKDDVYDDQQYQEVREAMGIVGFGEEEVENIFQVVASVLNMGNILFDEAPNPENPNDTIAVVSEDTWEFVEIVSHLLNVDPEAVQRALTFKIIETVGERYEVPLTTEQAAHARDALAKALYSGLFEWVVSRVNECIAEEGDSARAESQKKHSRKESVPGMNKRPGSYPSPKTPQRQGFKHFIGLLDIFGFETFEQNYFEQFLINYANEMLQQQFNHFVFEMEQQEYRQENITWSFVSFPDNKVVIDMIQGKGGLLALLDEQCLFPKATDETFAAKLYKELAGQNPRKRFIAPVQLQVQYAFAIAHYAGDVVYHTYGFLEKNRDTLHSMGADLLKSSSKEFVRKVGGIGANVGEAASPTPQTGKAGTFGLKTQSSSRGMRKQGTLSGQSLSSQFKNQLMTLLDKIGNTHPHYIRCLKPNDQNVAHRFNHSRISEQLRYGGVLEAVKVARAGFPVRLPHVDFVKRYGLLGVFIIEEAIQACRGIASQEKKKPAASGGGVFGGVQRLLGQSIGGGAAVTNMLSLKELSSSQVEEVARNLVVHLAPLLRSKPLTERQIDQEREALKLAYQTSSKSFQATLGQSGVQIGCSKVFFRQLAFNSLERMRTVKLVDASTIIQTCFRRYRHYSWYQIQKRALFIIQRIVRGFIGRRRFRNIQQKRASLKIQTNWRRYKHRSSYVGMRFVAISLQAWRRGYTARKLFKTQRQSRHVQVIQRFLMTFKDRSNFLRKRAAVIRIQCLFRRKAAEARLVLLRRKSKDVKHLKFQLNEFRSIVNDKSQQFKEEAERAQKELEMLRSRNAELMEKLQTTAPPPAIKAAEELGLQRKKSPSGDFKKNLEDKETISKYKADTEKMKEELEALRLRNLELQNQMEEKKRQSLSNIQPQFSTAATRGRGPIPPPVPRLSPAEAKREEEERIKMEAEMARLKERGQQLEAKLAQVELERENQRMYKDRLESAGYEVDSLRQQNAELQRLLAEATQPLPVRIIERVRPTPKQSLIKFSNEDQIGLDDVVDMSDMLLHTPTRNHMLSPTGGAHRLDRFDSDETFDTLTSFRNEGDNMHERKRSYSTILSQMTEDVRMFGGRSETGSSGSIGVGVNIESVVDKVQDDNGSKKKITLYKVNVRNGEERWTVERRYRDFRWLNRQLEQNLPPGSLPDFPKPRIFLWPNSSKEEKRFVQMRRSALELFLTDLIASRERWLTSSSFEDGPAALGLYATDPKSRMKEAVARQALLLFLDQNEPMVEGEDDGISTIFG